jgi:hypothetical protein
MYLVRGSQCFKPYCYSSKKLIQLLCFFLSLIALAPYFNMACALDFTPSHSEGRYHLNCIAYCPYHPYQRAPQPSVTEQTRRQPTVQLARATYFLCSGAMATRPKRIETECSVKNFMAGQVQCIYLGFTRNIRSRR